jgi:hypothetical protein
LTIEELPGDGGPDHTTDSPWITTFLALGAGMVLGVVMMLAIGPQVTPAPSESPGASAIAQASPSPRPSFATAFPIPIFPESLDPSARQSLTVDDVEFSFAVPSDGWARYDALYISKSRRGPQGAEAMIFWAHFPDGLYATVCAESRTGWWEGMTAAELPAALPAHLPGTELVSGPTDVTVGGLPAKQVVLFAHDDTGCGPGYFYTWDGEGSRSGPLWGDNLLGDTITVWVFEVAGEPFVIASQTHLNAGAALEAEVLAIVDSIEFAAERPALPEISFAEVLTPAVAHRTTVDGVTFSLSAPAEHWVRYGELYVSKDAVGSQTAEAMVAWTRFPDGQFARACTWSGVPLAAATAEDLATSLATSVPGTVLVGGPRNVTLRGVAATRVDLWVSNLSACGRGYFFTWRGGQGGPFWDHPSAGDTITVWIFDLGGGPFIIAAESHGTLLDSEVQQLIDSIEFAL